MTSPDHDMLVRNGFIAIPGEPREIKTAQVRPGVATIVSNLAHYGYTLDGRALSVLMALADPTRWWSRAEVAIKAIVGSDRNMDEFIVYKNFPREVLDMDQATQVFHQIMIYLGMPYAFLREAEIARPVLGDIKRLKVLALADETTEAVIFSDLIGMPHRWSDNQTAWARRLVVMRNGVVFSEYGFKENAVALVVGDFAGLPFQPSSASDVLRICAGLSGGDISLRERVRFRNFSRPERRRLIEALEGQAHLADDMAARPEIWKRLMQRLHPGDHTAPAVQAAYDGLYNRRIKAFSALVDPPQPSLQTLDIAMTRPGEYLRRFHAFYGLSEREAVDRLLAILDRLTTRQLVGLRGYLRTINQRMTLIYPPRSNWSRAQIVQNGKTPIGHDHLHRIDLAVSEILRHRLAAAFPEGITLDLRLDQIKLQTNDQRLAEYGRGTSFDIPEGVSFVRSASYWANDRGVTTWYDNGWNFFDETWNPLGTCAWNAQYFGRKSHSRSYAAAFSGDPVNIRDLRGRACQMADLYLDRLSEEGVRYAVWSVLCFSKVKFSDAQDVLATLQWGEDAETGKTYEPSRVQMVFPLKSDNYTSYVAYIDVKRRKLVYMDVALPASLRSADENSARLQAQMPAYVEYLDSLPSILELVQDAPVGTMPVLYDDAATEIQGGRAFVFRPTRQDNAFDRVSVTDLVNV